MHGSFQDFESWLIAQGHFFWESALEDPDNFLSLNIFLEEGDNPDVSSEAFYQVWESVFEEKTQEELEVVYPQKYQQAVIYSLEEEESWKQSPEKLQASYPQLYRNFYEAYENRLALYIEKWTDKLREITQRPR